MPYTSARVLLARNMKRYRSICKISQMGLAERVGCSPTLIANIEIKKRFPSAENLDRISAALEIPLSELFADDSPTMERLSAASEVRERLENGFKLLMDEALGNQPKDQD